MSKQQIVDELHKPARRNFQRRRTIIKGLRDLFQADLAEFIPYSRVNKGYKYILLVVDCYSKFAWARPLKSKKGQEVAKAMKNILSKAAAPPSPPLVPPNNFQTDAGREFYNSHFSKVMNEYNINHYSTYSAIKASMAERLVRTIKGKLYKSFSLRGNHKWIDILQQVMQQYNNTKHRTTGMRPVDVTAATKLDVYDNLKVAGKARYKVGDFVRISKYKSVFSKAYHGNWTAEHFKVIKVKHTDPVTYLLEDMHGQPILGGFYELELQKIANADAYLIERVLKRKGTKLLVKYLGYSNEPPTWIDKKDLLK